MPQPSLPGDSAGAHEHRFLAQVLANPVNRAILAAWPQLDLPDGWLVAGCLFQTVWNLQSGRPPPDGIDRFLVPATCVAIRPAREGEGVEVYAPHGLGGLYAGVLTPNPLTDHRELFRAKAKSYQSRWPWLRVEEAAADAR